MSDTTNTTKTPEEIVRQTIEGHVASAGNALDPYFLRATSTVSRLRQKPGGILGSLNMPEGMAEMLGITEERLEETTEESMQLTAVSELMMDVMHFCKARGLNFNEVGRIAVDRYREEMEMANDVVLYGREVPDNFFRSAEENPNHKPEPPSDL